MSEDKFNKPTVEYILDKISDDIVKLRDMVSEVKVLQERQTNLKDNMERAFTEIEASRKESFEMGHALRVQLEDDRKVFLEKVNQLNIAIVSNKEHFDGYVNQAKGSLYTFKLFWTVFGGLIVAAIIGTFVMLMDHLSNSYTKPDIDSKFAAIENRIGRVESLRNSAYPSEPYKK